MAGIFSRMFRVGQAEAHSIVDKFEDPIKMTEQGIRDLKKDLAESMKSLAQVKGITIRMRNESENHKKAAADYETKAMALLQKAQSGAMDMADAERLATEALSRKEDSGKNAVRVSQELVAQENMANQLQKNVDKLRTTINRYETDLVTLRARAKTAAATKKLNAQIANVDSGGTMAMLEKMKSKVEEDESLAAAYGDMANANTTIDDQINDALNSGEALPAASDNLAALKAKMGLT